MTNFQYDTNFLTWFIGFFEGDGCFIAAPKQNSSHKRIEILQSATDLPVLHYIRSTLRFGVVSGPLDDWPHMASYVAYGPETISVLQQIFKNNLCTENSRTRFSQFFSTDAGTLRYPSLKDPWLSGLIDTKGCFRGAAESDGRFRTVFSISLKDEALVHNIRGLFKEGNIYHTDGQYTLELSGKREKLRIIDYINRYPLYSHKRIVFLKWNKVNHLLKDVIRNREAIIKLNENLNKWRKIENLKIESELHRDM